MKAVHQPRERDFRRIVTSKMHVIVSAVDLDKRRREVPTRRRKQPAHVVSHVGGEDLAAVFGHEDQVSV